MTQAASRWQSGVGRQPRAPVVELIVFGMVGIFNNSLLYGLYLILTHFAFSIFIAMTLAFIAGIFLSWLLNGVFTFRAPLTRRSGIRMLCLYAAAYLCNLMLLWLAVGVFALPHQLVQLAIMLLLAIVLYMLQRFWVFSTV